MILIGMPPLDANAELHVADVFCQTKAIEANYSGNARARELLLRVTGWWREGKWPVEKVVRPFPARDVEEVLRGMDDGSAIKLVLV